MANVAAAFPRKPRGRAPALVRRVFGHFGRLLFEMLKFSGLSRETRCWRRVEFEGDERVRARTRRGKARCCSPGHFGYWEINAMAHGAALWPMGVLARPLDNLRLHELLERMRGCTGNYVIYRRGALRRVLKALAANDAVAILIDQHIQAPDAVTRELLRSAGGHHAGARRAGAADGRAGDSGVRHAAAGAAATG